MPKGGVRKHSPYLTLSRDKDGYLFCGLKGKSFRVHRIVAMAFIINPENKPCINHKNGIKYDNNVDNLEWCTVRENTIHAYKNGLINVSCGENHVYYKLTKVEVKEIIELSKTKTAVRQIAKRYKIHAQTAHDIINNITWKRIQR